MRGETCKTGVSRKIPILTIRLKDELVKLKATTPDNPSALVFGINSIRKSFKNACKTAKIDDFRIHDCRHTAITKWIDSGMNPAKAMKYSGHTVMSTFMRYLNLKTGEMQRDAEAFRLYEEQRTFRVEQSSVPEVTGFIN